MQTDPEAIEVKYLHDFIDFQSSQVLEIGCGSGRMTWRYADAAKKIIGIDPDAGKLAMAFSEHPPELSGKATFIQALAENLPFSPGTFHHVIFAWSF